MQLEQVRLFATLPKRIGEMRVLNDVVEEHRAKQQRGIAEKNRRQNVKRRAIKHRQGGKESDGTRRRMHAIDERRDRNGKRDGGSGQKHVARRVDVVVVDTKRQAISDNGTGQIATDDVARPRVPRHRRGEKQRGERSKRRRQHAQMRCVNVKNPIRTRDSDERQHA